MRKLSKKKKKKKKCSQINKFGGVEKSKKVYLCSTQLTEQPKLGSYSDVLHRLIYNFSRLGLHTT